MLLADPGVRRLLHGKLRRSLTAGSQRASRVRPIVSALRVGADTFVEGAHDDRALHGGAQLVIRHFRQGIVALEACSTL